MTSDRPEPLSVLRLGEVELEGRLPWSSNATFLVRVALDATEMRAVYKPERGEQWLWDFPRGLFVREVAAFVLSEALGWAIVPETVARSDGPYGAGALQRFVDADFSQHYFTLLEDALRGDELRRIAAFDLIANNADRKSGHCIIGDDGRVWAIDQGLCFHAESKLRTVMWDFAGEDVPVDLVDDIAELAAGGLPPELGQCLAPDELRALKSRMDALVRRPVFPQPTARRAYPWPMV